ncbi:MAG: hypothetical protein NTW62_02440 [Candidatus Nomurabacteria bacterium]|nr:hypothetical protein [Candidatus Nomurabacteria bacterium]
MINLLPTEEKKRILNEYRFRVLTFSFYMIGVCFCIAGIALLPSYFLVSLKENIANQKFIYITSLPVSQPDKETMGVIKDINTKISTINDIETKKFLVLENAFDQVILQKMPDIKIIELGFNINKDGAKEISVRGFAPNRERLLIFRQALESDSSFVKVDLPISNFVKEKNINFNLTLISA